MIRSGGGLGESLHAQAQLLLAGVQRGGAGEQRGDVAVRADAEHDQIERRRARAVVDRSSRSALRVALGALLGSELALHAVHRSGATGRHPAAFPDTSL